jgi:hypothetical protein
VTSCGEKCTLCDNGVDGGGGEGAMVCWVDGCDGGKKDPKIPIVFGEKGVSWFKSRFFVKWYLMYIHDVDLCEMVRDVHTM